MAERQRDTKRKPGTRPRLLPEGPELSWRRILESRPTISPNCEVVETRGDMIELRIRGRRPGYLVPPLSWIIRPRLTKTVRLDGIGAEVWRLCDGHSTFESMVDRFAADNKLTFHESRVAMMNYIHLLMERGALIVEMPRAGP